MAGRDRPPGEFIDRRSSDSVELMNTMGFDAMALGEGDLLKLGVEGIQQHVENATFALLSANVILADTGKTLVEPYIIRQVGERQIAIIGLTGKLADAPAEALLGLEIVDPSQALNEVIYSVQEQADVILLLSHAGLDANIQIAQEFAGRINLIISGGGSEFLYVPQALEGSPAVIQADASKPGHAGRRIGLGTWSFDTEEQLAQYNWYNYALGPQIP